MKYSPLYRRAIIASILTGILTAVNAYFLFRPGPDGLNVAGLIICGGLFLFCLDNVRYHGRRLRRDRFEHWRERHHYEKPDIVNMEHKINHVKN